MCWRKGEAVADGVEDGVVDRLLVKSAPRSPRRKVEAIMAEEVVVEAIIMAEAIMAEATMAEVHVEAEATMAERGWNSTGVVQFLNNNAGYLRPRRKQVISKLRVSVIRTRHS